jgi:predicted ATPase
VTFLFSDVAGSTKVLRELGAESYAVALAEHRRALRAAFSRHGGVEVDTQGDAFFYAFSSAPSALQAAKEGQAALADGPIRVRMGLHTATPLVADGGYVGLDVHRAARIAAAGHAGQVLLSKETGELGDLPVLDLGEHRLKDFDEPAWIFQLGTERFPPLNTTSNTNLRRPASSFIGRAKEREDVVTLIRTGARLVTLTGPGGSGKTRLAIEAAAKLIPDFKAGVFWVGLAALRDAALVTDTIAQTLGARDGLAAHIGERELLLLLDNLEQVIEAASELASLVQACPNLTILVTSRELLRVTGEVEYPVFPLAELEAVELFCARARRVPDEPISELCRRLDNLPLALELAAARASVLSPRQILERLAGRLDVLRGGRDSDPRQATLRATMEWSHDLLTEVERRHFAGLSVFAGGCTLDAAEAVVEADLDNLGSLVDKSLLRHIDERFSMLETIREFANERLVASGEAAELRRRHAQHFLALVEEAYPHLKGSPKAWLDRLGLEHDNLRTALDWLESSDETQLALQMAGALYRFWYLRGHFEEGRRRLEGLLRVDGRPTAARARALNGAAVMAVDPTTARLRAEEGLALHRELGDAWGATYSTYMLATAATEESHWARAQPLFEQSLQGFRDLGDEHYVLLATDALAWMYRQLDDVERGRGLHEEVLRRARAQSNDAVVALQLAQLATFALQDERVGEAFSMLKESLRLYRDLGLLGGVFENLSRFAEAHAVMRRAGLAARLLSRAEALREEIGGGPAWVAEMRETTLAAIHAQLDEVAFAEAWARGRALSVEEAVALALES